MLCTFFTYQASHLYVTNDPLSYFPEDKPLIQETRAIHDDLAGIKVFFIALEAENDKAFLEPANLQKISKIQMFLAKQAVFDTTLSIADHLKYVNKEFQGEFSADTLPSTRQLVAQYLMFFHRSELDSYISHDYRRANIVVRHNISDSHTLNRYIDELKDFANQISGDGITARVGRREPAGKSGRRKPHGLPNQGTRSFTGTHFYPDVDHVHITKGWRHSNDPLGDPNSADVWHYGAAGHSIKPWNPPWWR